jgi:O-antigen/teichoic acid export membrane protein
MEPNKSLLKNTFIYAIGNFGSKILTFLLLPLYSFYLTTDEFGNYDLILATITLLVPFVSVQMSEAVYRWLLDSNGEQKTQSRIISNGLIVVVSLSSIFFLLYFAFSGFIHYAYKGYFAGILLVSCFLPFFQQTLRGLGKNRLYALVGIVNTFLVLVSNICFLVFFKLKLESLFIATILSNFLTIIFISCAIKIHQYISFKNVSVKEIKEMVGYSWPLIPNSISWWLINVADKYLILYFLTVQANGVYAVSSRFPSIITLLNSIFLMAWQDHGISSKNDENSNSFFSKTLNIYITLELSVVLVLISVSHILIRHLLDAKFYESANYMPLLFIGVAYSAFTTYIGVIYQRQKNTKNIFTTTLVGGVINILISILLLKKIGLYAPALGTLVSFFVILFIRIYQVEKIFPVKINYYKMAILTALCLVFAFLVNLENLTVTISLIITSIIVAVLFNMQTINIMLKMVTLKFKKSTI